MTLRLVEEGRPFGDAYALAEARYPASERLGALDRKVIRCYVTAAQKGLWLPPA
jgi:hypothetical protein